MEPLSASVVFASIGSAFKFADLAVRIAEVGSENEVFVRTIHVVREDLNEVDRLLSIESIQRKLASIPGKLPWIKGAVTNTKTALNDIGEAVERARAEKQATGSIRFETRVRWVFNDHEKILHRTSELSICHQQLSNVLGYLIRLEDVPVSLEPPAYQDITYFDDVIMRHRGRGASASSGHSTSSQKLLKPVEPLETAKRERTIGIDVDIEHVSVLHNPQRTASADVPFIRQEYTRTSSCSVSSQAVSTPCSPAPTYVSATQVGSMISHHPFKHGRRTGVESPDPTSQLDTARTYYSSIPQLPLLKAGVMEERGCWCSQTKASSPEWEGDIVCLSATNSQGPVDPFEFDPGPQLPTIPMIPEMEGGNRSSETPGNPSAPMEPSGIDDRLSMASLSKEEYEWLYSTKRSTPTGGYTGSAHPVSMQKATMVPARTRTFASAARDCTISWNELSPASPALDEIGADLKAKATINAVKRDTTALEPTSGSNTSSNTPYPLLHGLDHTSNTLHASVSLLKLAAQYNLRQSSPEHSGQSLPRSPSVVSLNKRTQCSKPQDPAIITRMRSQKHIIALLESIET